MSLKSIKSGTGELLGRDLNTAASRESRKGCCGQTFTPHWRLWHFAALVDGLVPNISDNITERIASHAKRSTKCPATQEFCPLRGTGVQKQTGK